MKVSISDDPYRVTPRPEAEELGALASALAAKTGFTLLLGRITTPRHARRLQEELRARVNVLQPGYRLLHVELEQPVAGLLPTIVAKADIKPRPDAILLSGIERCFSDLTSNQGQRILEELDAERSRFSSDIPCPLLVWLPLSILRALAHYAPHMFRSSAKVYFFDEATAEPDPVLAQLEAATEEQEARSKQLHELTLPDGASAEEQRSHLRKLFQAVTAQQQLRDAGSPFLQSGYRSFVALGDAALRTGSFRLAAASYEKAERIAAERDDSTKQIGALLGRAEAHKALGEFREAMDSDQFALMLAKKFGYTDLRDQAASHLQDLCRHICTLRRGSLPNAPADQARPASPAVAKPKERDALRAQLQAVVLDDSDFNLFCLEHFMEFAARHSMSVDYRERMELLLQTIEPKRLKAALSQTPSARARR